MKLRSMVLMVVVLACTTGCVSVPAPPHTPGAVASAQPRPVPAAQGSAAPGAPPAVHDALGSAEERRKEHRRKKEARRAPGRSDAAVVTPAPRETRVGPRRYATARPEAHRPESLRRARPERTYDMETVCAAGRGVASADVVGLCRSAYGR
ncbi:hypothetical protein QFZ58_000750 [Streptomyces sp. B1I3]|nr:hypothetical protein [Streptomyces sp. B1I3]